MYEKVLAHYYVDPSYLPFAAFRSRVGAECKQLEGIGDIILISPDMQRMACRDARPGLYKIIEIKPNSKSPYPVYDYHIYGVWTELGKTKYALVKPVFTVEPKLFGRYNFIIDDCIDDEGVISKEIMVTDNEGLIVKDLHV